MGLKNKKRIIAIILIVVIVLISGITYGYWNKEYIGKDNTNNFNCLKIEVKENKEGITLNNSYPITDEEGIETEGYEVTIENKCEIVGNYEVILNEIQGSNLKEEHIKVAVDKNYQILSKYEKVNPRIGNSEKAYKIKEGIITPKAKIKILVQEWIDYDTTKEEGENKTFNNKITIEGTTKINDKLLAGKIIKENKVIEEEPDFSIGFPNANTSEEEIKKLSGLYKSEDNEGESYYFRGAVENNYVKFGKGKTINNQEEDDLIWRIVRINGDGSIRLVSQESVGQSRYNYSNSNNNNNIKAAGYTYDNERACTKDNPCTKEEGTPSIIKSYLEDWYQSNLSRHDTKIATSYFCNDTSMYENGTSDYNFGTPRRLYNNQPSLRCPNPAEEDGSLQLYGGVYKLKIGLLSADELNMAGLAWTWSDSTTIDTNYLYFNEHYSWTLSPWFFRINENQAYIIVLNTGILSYYTGSNDGTSYVHPVINLKPDVKVTGEGTSANPYVVSE